MSYDLGGKAFERQSTVLYDNEAGQVVGDANDLSDLSDIARMHATGAISTIDGTVLVHAGEAAARVAPQLAKLVKMRGILRQLSDQLGEIDTGGEVMPWDAALTDARKLLNDEAND